MEMMKWLVSERNRVLPVSLFNRDDDELRSIQNAK